MKGTVKTFKRSFGKTRRACETSLRLLRQKQISLSMIPYHIHVAWAYKESKKEIAVKAFLNSIPYLLKEGYEETFQYLYDNWDVFLVKEYKRMEVAVEGIVLQERSISMGDTVGDNEFVPPLVDWKCGISDVNPWYSGQTVQDVTDAISRSYLSIQPEFTKEKVKRDFWEYVKNALIENKKPLNTWTEETEEGLF